MDQNRFAALTRSLTPVPSRRAVLRGLAVSVVGLTARGSGGVEAKKRKKSPRNAFGCVDVGKPCRGSNRLCCSGICQGKKPKKGKKDTSRCVAHDASTCQAGQHLQDCGGTTDVSCITSTGATNGNCNTTTGNAPYCLEEAYCHACKKDADCRRFCGPAAACIQCIGCTDEGGTACASPTDDLCEFPAP